MPAKNAPPAQRTVDDETARAARYKRALLDAGQAATERADVADAQRGYIDQALGAIRSDLDMYKTRSYFYKMTAAQFDWEAAKDAYGRANLGAKDAALTVQAWRAVEHHIALQSRRSRLDMKKAALRSRTQEARPWQEQVAAAQARFAGAVERAIDRSEGQLTVVDDQIKEQESIETSAAVAVQAAIQQAAQLAVEQDTIHGAADEFARRRQRLIDGDVIDAEESLASAVQRLTGIVASAEAALARIAQQRADAQIQRDIADQRLEREGKALTEAEIAHSQLNAQLQKLISDAATLGGIARIRNLMQTDDLDLTVELVDILDAVEKARAGADREIVELNEAMAAGERALLSLRTDKLLPPRLQVQKVIEELTAAGVSAVPGWKYLATHIRPDQHRRVIEELPAVVDGVIVYEVEPAVAAEHLTKPVEEAVAIAHVSVFGEHPAPYVVCGPAPAQYDEAAAEVEFELRTRAHTEITTARDMLLIQRSGDEQLLARLNTFRAGVPDDGAAGLRERVGAAAAKLGSAREHVEATSQLRKSLQATLDDLADEQSREDTRRLTAQGAVPSVSTLADDEAEKILPGQRRLEKIPAELDAVEEKTQRAQKRLSDARSAAAELAAERASIASDVAKLKAKLVTLPAAEPTDQSIDAAQAAVESAEEELRQRFPEETLRREVDTAEKEVTAAAESWKRHTDAEQARALELQDSIGAGDQAARQVAEERAQKAAESAARQLGEANSESAAAEGVYYAARRQFDNRKSRADPGLVQATDRDSAAELANACDAESEQLEVQRHRREQERNAAVELRDQQRKRAEVLTALVVPLRHIDAGADKVDIVISDDDAEVQARVSSIANDLDEADGLFNEADAAFTECADAVANWASEEKFYRLAEDEHGQAVRRVRAMLRDKASVLRVAASAETLGDDLRLRSSKIAEQLQQVEATKANIGAKLTDLVSEALSSLGRVSRLSELPEGIGNWDHRRFIDVSPRTAPTRDQIGLRVADLTDSMVNGRTVESDPVELLWMATDAAVSEGFRARILKPTPEQSITPLPVSEMQKWSGAENLTASVMLFCVLARLRAERRNTDGAPAAGGVLPLDNPVGKSSLPAFLTLHRKVARANGVQLVYWTGLGDLGALTVFPRIAALRKRPSINRAGRAYVAVDEDRSRTDADDHLATQQVLDVITSVRRES